MKTNIELHCYAVKHPDRRTKGTPRKGMSSQDLFLKGEQIYRSDFAACSAGGGVSALSPWRVR
jgi:hypothetical protein